MSDERKKKNRSPSYPAIDLEEAVERARRLYERENRHLVPVDTAIGAWGYSPGSGAGMVVIAAMKKFGLLEDSGSGADRRVRLTENAYQILIDEREESPERRELLRQAALQPRIHAELWNRYGAEQPSDSTLRYELRKMEYSDEAAQKLTAEWRRTFEYVNLGEESCVPQADQEASPAANPVFPTATTPATGQQRTQATQAGQSVQLPIAPGKYATLSGPFPVTEAEWRQMVAILEVMRVGLIRPDDEPISVEECV